MRLDRRVRKTYLKIRTIFHNEDCDCDRCIKESLIGRCGMGDSMFPKFSYRTYLTNRLILFPIYELWLWFGMGEWKDKPNLWYSFLKWWGNRRWFGMTFLERYEYEKELKSKLNKSMLEVQKKYPNLEWE